MCMMYAIMYANGVQYGGLHGGLHGVWYGQYQERMMTSLFFHGGGGRACDFVFSRGESRIFRVY